MRVRFETHTRSLAVDIVLLQQSYWYSFEIVITQHLVHRMDAPRMDVFTKEG